MSQYGLPGTGYVPVPNFQNCVDPGFDDQKLKKIQLKIFVTFFDQKLQFNQKLQFIYH